MKKFDLKAALNGKPVKLRGGFKAIVYYRVPDEFSYTGGSTEPYPLIGIVFNKDGTIKSASENWKDCGAYTVNQGDLDIVGMWEEPKKQTKKHISIEDLPKPFEPKDGDKYFYFSENGVEHVTFRETDDSDTGLAENGQCFRTEQDAQKWLDFMKSMME